MQSMKGLAVLSLIVAGLMGCAKPGSLDADLGAGDRSVPRADAGDLGGGGDLGIDQGVADLAGSDGSRADLGRSDLAGADLAGADLMPCTLVPQSGCGSGEKCVPDTSGNSCAANGTVATGMVCGASGSDDCVAGDLCSSDQKGSTLMCRQLCNADGDCKQGAVAVGGTAEPGNVAHCIVTYTGLTATSCTFACNPVTSAGASGCPTGLACIYGGTSTLPELTDCVTPGATAEGGTCTDTSNCAAGLVCVGPTSGTAHCRYVCRNATDGDCPTGDTCEPPGSPATPMFGFCCPSGNC